MSQEDVFVGVDVSKTRLDVRVLNAGARRFVNAADGWASLRAWLKTLKGVPVVGLEPSGGYERGVVRALLEDGFSVRWTDPSRVRALARAVGATAKTDAIDAELIARFVAQTGGRVVVRDPAREALRDLSAGRKAARETAERLERQAAGLDPGPAREALLRLAVQARAEAAGLEAAARAFVAAEPKLADDGRLLRTAPGVAELVAGGLMAHVPELGTLTGKAIAALVGVAPFARESGAWRGRAVCSGGRPEPRRLLYLAAMAARRCDAGVRGRFERLVARGKPRMVAMVAVMRHLLTALNAMIRDQKTWKAEPA